MRLIEIPDDGIVRIPIMDGDTMVGQLCTDLSDMPTIDAVPVVRCKNCKYYTTEDFDGDILCGCKLYCAMLDITPDGFCSYGERKEG